MINNNSFNYKKMVKYRLMKLENVNIRILIVVAFLSISKECNIKIFQKFNIANKLM